MCLLKVEAFIWVQSSTCVRLLIYNHLKRELILEQESSPERHRQTEQKRSNANSYHESEENIETPTPKLFL